MPWRRRVEPVLSSQAGDDATASLATILYHHHRRVSLDEIRRAIYTGDSEIPNALQIVEAAANFGLRARGVKIDRAALVAALPTPNIAHLLTTPGQFPRDLANEPRIRVRLRDDGTELDHDTLFAVVTDVSSRRVAWIDPFTGPTRASLEQFVSLASGIFLLFEDGPPPPRAKVFDGS
jgi:hypothetical protein